MSAKTGAHNSIAASHSRRPKLDSATVYRRKRRCIAPFGRCKLKKYPSANDANAAGLSQAALTARAHQNAACKGPRFCGAAPGPRSSPQVPAAPVRGEPSHSKLHTVNERGAGSQRIRGSVGIARHARNADLQRESRDGSSGYLGECRDCIAGGLRTQALHRKEGREVRYRAIGCHPVEHDRLHEQVVGVGRGA